MEIAPDGVAVLFGAYGEKASLAVCCGKQAQSCGAHAGKLIKEIAALVNGRGGGKPERAMAGVGDVSKINDALEQADSIILSQIG